MPWDGTELRLADVAPDGTLHDARTVAGGPGEWVAQADWTRDGRLLHTSDRTGWWNLYLDGEPVCPREEEFGGPLWKPGSRWFTPLDSGLIAVVHGRGAATLGILDPERGEVVDVAGPWTEFTPTLAAHGERVVAVEASPRSAHEVVELDARTGRARVIGTPHKDAVDPAHYPQPQVRTFSGPDGREIHAQVYSDITALHEAFATRLGLVTLHGPMAAGVDFLKNTRAQEHLKATLFAPDTVRTLASDGTALVPGRARGVTLGGCLALLAADLGTPHTRPSARGGLLCLEDVGEEPYRLDRYLAVAGRLVDDGVSGLLLAPGRSAARTRRCGRCSPTGSAVSACPWPSSSGSGTATGHSPCRSASRRNSTRTRAP
ncbi:hypothetical protein SHIRM173S_08140 [Streptomyces hirsutus]